MSNLNWCIDYLKVYNHISQNLEYNWTTLRALLNITMPRDLSEDFYNKQDDAIKEQIIQKEIFNVDSLDNGISLYNGDITSIKADAIVNACNNKLLGCFVPGHNCIDNAIHSFAGLQVRRDLMKIMKEQGYDEPNGRCKVTKAYNLPSKYIFHTVGPIYSGSKQDTLDLESCYLSCLIMADKMKLDSIVFCSISTGIFGFPIGKASDVAIKTVKDYLKNENKNIKKVIFNVFSDGDYNVYDRKIKEIN